MTRLAIACRQVDGVTGTTTTILEHVRRLAGLGWEVHVYAERLDEGRVAAAGGVPRRLRGLPVGGGLKRRFFAWRFDRALRGERYDLAWGHGDTWTQDVLSLHNCVHAAHEAVHGGPLPARSNVGRMHDRILRERGFRLLIANSELMRREVVERYGVPEERTAVIHPGYAPSRYRAEDRARLREPRRRELGAGPGELLVGLITSGDFAKRGVRRFLEALPLLSPVVRARLRVVVIGQEARLGPYRALARGTGVDVRFLRPTPDVPAYYHALDLYVHPALYEEFGQSVQEAMACGVAVLAGRRVGARELLGPSAPTMTIEGDDAASVARAMEPLLLDPRLREGLAERGRRAVLANAWDENFRKTYAALEGLLGR